MHDVVNNIVGVGWSSIIPFVSRVTLSTDHSNKNSNYLYKCEHVYSLLTKVRCPSVIYLRSPASSLMSSVCDIEHFDNSLTIFKLEN